MFSSFWKERGRPRDLEAKALLNNDLDANSDYDDNKDTTKNCIPC